MSKKSQSYVNPVFSVDFADIGILKRPEGYYAYASQGQVGGSTHNVQHSFSHDLVEWHRRADALPVKAIWASAQDYWAPDVVELSPNDFRLFFNAKTNDTGQGIGIAVSTTPSNFVALSTPLITGAEYINIDAKAFRNPVDGRWYLLWGSCFEPIKIQELDANLLGFKNPTEGPHYLLSPNAATSATKLYEAAWMTARFDEEVGRMCFYLFTSGSDAFGDRTYTVQVARSFDGPTSGFVTLAEATGKVDSIIYQSNAHFINPGASAITVDDEGEEWLISHATQKTDVPEYDELRMRPQDLWQVLRYTRRVMCIDRIRYENGWPYVSDGSPSLTPQAGPLINIP